MKGYSNREYALIQRQKARRQSKSLLFLFRQARILKLLGNHAPERILDFGCGVGTLLKHTASLFPSAICHGIDANPTAISLASKGVPNPGNLKFSMGTQKDNSLQDNFYNTIICEEVLEHLLDDREAIKFFKKKLRKGGSVIVTVPSGRRFLKVPSHYRVYTKESLMELFESHGFRTMHMKSYGVPILESLFVLESLIHKIKPPNHGSMWDYPVKRYPVYRRLIPMMRYFLGVDTLLSPLGIGTSLIAKFRRE